MLISVSKLESWHPVPMRNLIPRIIGAITISSVISPKQVYTTYISDIWIAWIRFNHQIIKWLPSCKIIITYTIIYVSTSKDQIAIAPWKDQSNDLRFQNSVDYLDVVHYPLKICSLKFLSLCAYDRCSSSKNEHPPALFLSGLRKEKKVNNISSNSKDKISKIPQYFHLKRLS